MKPLELPMPIVTTIPRYHDTQPPRLYRVGCSLRQGFLTGRSDSIEERMMRRLLERLDEGTLNQAPTTEVTSAD